VFLIVGLGNPGPEYADTRHNVGFRVIDRLSRRLGVRLTGRKFQSRNARTRIGGEDSILLCPTTYMNLSGMSVRTCADFFGVENNNILVVHDDLDLPVGRLKVVRRGGHAGHKGVESIVRHLGGEDFPRIRIGIGRPRHGEEISDYVLRPHYKDEKDIMDPVLDSAVRACVLVVSGGVESAMNEVNCQNLSNKEE
jgi:PTH1 family peptidyl-tRNA hydrolase